MSLRFGVYSEVLAATSSDHINTNKAPLEPIALIKSSYQRTADLALTHVKPHDGMLRQLTENPS